MKSKNNKWIESKKERRTKLDAEALFPGLRSGNVADLSSAITLVESTKVSHREEADKLLKLCLPHTGNSIRVGITGVPGVGKSTFIEAFGNLLLEKGKKIAVLAIDPSSSISGGSILGDKTRMQSLSTKDNVYIRPSAAGETLGGVARKTREAILLCEAAGYDFIIIETVGVGQSETVVKSMVDFFLLLMLSGAGDELQGIKKGIMEMADALVISKADGDNEEKAKLAANQYRNAMHLFHPNPNEWTPQVFTCSALTGKNIEKVEQVISEFESHVKANGSFDQNRKEQDKHWLVETLKELILSDFFHDEQLLTDLKEVEAKIDKGEITSHYGARHLFDRYKKK